MTTAQTASAGSPEELAALFADRVASRDVEALIALYDPEAVLQPEPGVVLVGHDEIRSNLIGFLSLEPTFGYSSAPDVLISGDVALVSNAWTMSGSTPDGTAISHAGTSADVFGRRQDGTWRILIDQPRGNAI